jgi:hypothetical protein
VDRCCTLSSRCRGMTIWFVHHHPLEAEKRAIDTSTRGRAKSQSLLRLATRGEVVLPGDARTTELIHVEIETRLRLTTDAGGAS